jgi:hypothetical protein
MAAGHRQRFLVSRLRSYALRRGKQVPDDREPQNTEQGIMNIEGKENLIIRNSLFDIRYSKWCGQKPQPLNPELRTFEPK